jgi:hypothetical protein
MKVGIARKDKRIAENTQITALMEWGVERENIWLLGS